MYVWIKATPQQAETSELGGMEGFTWATWNCFLHGGSRGNLKPACEFRPWQSLCMNRPFFSLSLSESLGEPWGSGRPWAALPNACSLSLSAHFGLLGLDWWRDFKAYRGDEIQVCNPSQIWTTRRCSVAWLQNNWDLKKKRLVKADSTHTLCFEHVFNKKKIASPTSFRASAATILSSSGVQWLGEFVIQIRKQNPTPEGLLWAASFFCFNVYTFFFKYSTDPSLNNNNENKRETSFIFKMSVFFIVTSKSSLKEPATRCVLQTDSSITMILAGYSSTGFLIP